MEKNDPFFSLSPLEFKIFSRIRADWMGRERQDKNRRSMLLRFAISKTRRNAALYRYNRERYVRSEDSYRFLLTFPTSLNSVCHSRNVYRSDRNARNPRRIVKMDSKRKNQKWLFSSKKEDLRISFL